MDGCGVQKRLTGVPAGPELAGVLAGIGPVERRLVDDAGVREVWPDAGEQVAVAQGWQKVIAWAEAQLNRAILQISGSRIGPEDEDWGREEVAAGLRWSGQAAADRIHVARTLAGRLIQTGRALAEGRITYRHAAELVHRLEPLADDTVDGVERDLIGSAGTKTVTQLGRAARRAVLKADPDGAERRRQNAKKRRRIEFTALEDSMAELRALLPAVDAARVRTALERVAGRSRERGDDRTVDARRADALVALIELGALTTDGHLPPPTLITGPEPTTDPEPPTDPEQGETRADRGEAGRSGVPAGPVAGPARNGASWLPARCRALITAVLNGKRAAGPRIALTAPHGTVLGAANLPGDLTGYGPVPAGVVRELAATSTWERWITDNHGVVTDLGRRTYRPSAELADLVRATYPTCMFPGCSQPSYRCDLDHNVRRTDGGPTSAANLVPLCRRHHRAKDEAGWGLTHHPTTGRCTWTSPAGRTYTVDPPTHDTGPDPDHEPADWTVPLTSGSALAGARTSRSAPAELVPVSPEDPGEPPPF